MKKGKDHKPGLLQSLFNDTVKSVVMPPAMLAVSLGAMVAFVDEDTRTGIYDRFMDALSTMTQGTTGGLTEQFPCVTEEHRCTINMSGYTFVFDDIIDFEAARTVVLDQWQDEYMGAPISPDVNGALAAVAIMTPYPYDYWLGKTYAESTFDIYAYNASTQARGLFQITPGAALETLFYMGQTGNFPFIPETALVKRNIIETDNGNIFRFEVANGVSERELLESVLYDPVKASFIAAEYNTRYLVNLNLPEGVKMDSLTAYMLHWQGPGGAQKFYRAYARDPDQPAWRVFSSNINADIIKDHRTIFFERDGAERSMREMLEVLRYERGIGEVEIGDLTNAYMPQVEVTTTNMASQAILDALSMSTTTQVVEYIPYPRERPEWHYQSTQ